MICQRSVRVLREKYTDRNRHRDTETDYLVVFRETEPYIEEIVQNFGK